VTYFVGTHWVWEIIQMLYKQKAELVDTTKEEWMMEHVPKENYDKMESPRILNTHIHFKNRKIYYAYHFLL
jgi:hypothetical protein